MPPRAGRGSSEAESGAGAGAGAGADISLDYDAASLIDEYLAWEKDAESALDRRLRDQKSMTKMILQEALQNPDWTFSEVESKLKDGAAAYRLLQDVELRRIKDKRDKVHEAISSKKRKSSTHIDSNSNSFPSNDAAAGRSPSAGLEVASSNPPPTGESRVLRTPRRGPASQDTPGTPAAVPIALPKRNISQVSPASESSSPTKKRAKPAVATPGSQGTRPRTITFDEVYQGGKPEYWHSIVKYPDVPSGKWYILKCESLDHTTHFGNHRTLQGAAKHLNGIAHGLERRQEVAVRELGWEVLHCDDDLAQKNNAAFDDALRKGYKILNTVSKGTKRRQPTLPKHPPLPPKSSRGKFIEGVTPPRWITRPEPGGLYYAYWRDDDKYYLVMVLKWKDNDKCGLPELANGLSGLGLLRSKVRSPECYVFNKEKTKILGWADGFRDGEDYETEREFPVLFIQDSPCKASWVEAGDLAHYDHDNPKYGHELFDVKEHRAKIAREAYARGKGYSSYQEFRADHPTLQRPDDMFPGVPEEISPLTPSSRRKSRRLSESGSGAPEDYNGAAGEDGDANMVEAPPAPSVGADDSADGSMSAEPSRPSADVQGSASGSRGTEGGDESPEVGADKPAANVDNSTDVANDARATKTARLDNSPSAEDNGESRGDTQGVAAPVGPARLDNDVGAGNDRETPGDTQEVAAAVKPAQGAPGQLTPRRPEGRDSSTETQPPAPASHPAQRLSLSERLQRRRLDHVSSRSNPFSNIRETLSCVYLVGYEAKDMLSWKAPSASEYLKLDLDSAASVVRAAPGQAVPVELHPPKMISARTTATGMGVATVTVSTYKGQGGIAKSAFEFGEREGKAAMEQAQEFEAWVKAVKEAWVKASKEAKSTKEVEENGRS